MQEFLAAAALVVLVFAAVLVATTWWVLRRIRRSRLVATGTRAVADGLLALRACRLRPTPHRGAAVQALRISREHRLLRQRVRTAQRYGAHLGDVPALLPRLEAEGRQLEAALGRLVGSPLAADELLTRADRHLAAVTSLSEAVVGATSVPVSDSGLAQEAQEAAVGLRLHTAAYRELRTGPDHRHRP